ncbi:hypothetical protein Tco_0420958, partial [Tanacetum coccineum]
PDIKASYSASLLVASNLNLKALVNSIPSGFVSIRPAPKPSTQDDPSVNNVYGSGSSTSASVIVAKGSSSGCSTMKSAKICPFTDVLFMYCAVSVGSSAISFFICLNAALAFAVYWKSLFFVHFFKALKNGSDFSADLDRNLFRLANFPFRFYTSFRHFGDGRLKTASILSGHTFIPLVFTLYPKNMPSSTLKTKRHFGITEYPLARNESRFFLIFLRHFYLVISFVSIYEALEGVSA